MCSAQSRPVRALFDVTEAELEVGRDLQPLKTVTPPSQAYAFVNPLRLADGRTVILNDADDREVLLYDPEQEHRPLQVMQLDLKNSEPAVEPIPFRNGLLIALAQWRGNTAPI